MCVTLPSTINTVIGGLCLPEELVFSLRLRLLILKLNLDLGLIAAEVGGGVAAEMGVDAAVVALEAAGVDVADNGDDNVGAVDSFVAAAAEEEAVAAVAGAGGGGANGGDRVALIAFNGSTTDTLLSTFDLDANICAWVGRTGDSIDDCLLLSSFDDVE